MDEDLLGISEVAKVLGVSRQRVHQLADSDPDFPNPVAKLSRGRLWSRVQISEWDRRKRRSTGRPKGQRLDRS